MTVRYPRPLREGDRIGVTAPSSGVAADLRPRLDLAVGILRERGFDVEIGSCLDGTTHLSAPAAERAAELTAMLLDPAIAAIVPPWGGETMIDLLPLLDFDAIAAAEPTWLVGYSDTTTLMLPLTVLSGVATLHGGNLMDTPYAVPPPLLDWIEAAGLAAGTTFRQSSPGVHRSTGWDDWVADPGVSEYRFDGTGGWRRLDGGSDRIDVSGRIIGGCIETIHTLAGTPFGSTGSLRDDGLLVYVEAAEDNAFAICRALHGMRLAGFFEGANAILVGRTSAPDSPTLTQDAAVLDALGALDVPIVADVECGHPPPRMQLVNGALGRLVMDDGEAWLEQTLA
jgi:muramoyltetrapeptide carboxypeptidase LdcA involved in peptidoglycan recycling